jgi:hypothetical protein
MTGPELVEDIITRKQWPYDKAEAPQLAQWEKDVAAMERVISGAEANGDTDTAAAVRIRLEVLQRRRPQPFTRAQLEAATQVRTSHGWYRIIRVNEKSVTHSTGRSSTINIPLANIVAVTA